MMKCWLHEMVSITKYKLAVNTFNLFDLHNCIRSMWLSWEITIHETKSDYLDKTLTYTKSSQRRTTGWFSCRLLLSDSLRTKQYQLYHIISRHISVVLKDFLVFPAKLMVTRILIHVFWNYYLTLIFFTADSHGIIGGHTKILTIWFVRIFLKTVRIFLKAVRIFLKVVRIFLKMWLL